MNKYQFLKETFPDIEPMENKIFVKNRLLEILQFLKNSPELYYDSLFSIIAIDYLEYVELIYILDSTYFNESINLCIRVKNKTETITHIYPSAYFFYFYKRTADRFCNQLHTSQFLVLSSSALRRV